MGGKTKPKTKTTKTKTTSGGSRWSGPDGFLARGWPDLVRTSDVARTGDDDWRPETMLAAFRLWEANVPDELRLLLAPLETLAPPPLFELELRTWAPDVVKGRNTAEQRILTAQQYPPLWKELFAGAIELASTGGGDIWMYAYSPFPDEPAQIYLYDHVGQELGAPEADGVESWLFRAALVGAQEAGQVDRKVFAAAIERLANRVGTAAYPEMKIAPYQPETATAYWTDRRARWLETLLSENDPSDAEIRAGFDLEATDPITEDAISSRADLFSTFPPTAFFFTIASFFSGNDACLALAIQQAAASRAPIVRDLAALATELRDGRKELGVIADVQTLRDRVRALRLWDPPSEPGGPLAPEIEAELERAARDGTLEELAWRYVHDAGVAAAIGERWKRDPALAPSIELLARLQKDDGYRDEDVIAQYLATGDRRTLPLLVARARDPRVDRPVMFVDIVAEVGDGRAVAPLAHLARVVNRFHGERLTLTRLVHNAGDVAHAPLLRDIVRRFPVLDSEGSRQEMLANAVLALGDLGDVDAVPLIRPLLETEVDALGTDTHIDLRNAVLYALAELGAIDILPALIERAATDDDVYRSPGLLWALGRLAANPSVDDASRGRVKQRLEATRISERDIEFSDGTTRKLSIADFFAEDASDYKDVACEIAREHSLVLLGAPIEPLRELVTTLLSAWEERSSGWSGWSGYDAYAMVAWALIALRHQPQLGTELARPFLGSDLSTARTLARRALG